MASIVNGAFNRRDEANVLIRVVSFFDAPCEWFKKP